MIPWFDPAAEIILRSTRTSPYGRKVRIAISLLRLGGRITCRDADTRDPNDDLRRQNPLGKMPCLIIGDEPFFDSNVILQVLDGMAGGGRLLPAATDHPARYRALRQAVLADGIADAALLMVYEPRFREPDQVSDTWLGHQRGKVMRAIGAFHATPPDPATPDIVSISLACALGYLDWRRPVDWRADNPVLVEWLETFARNTPAFLETGSER